MTDTDIKAIKVGDVITLFRPERPKVTFTVTGIEWDAGRCAGPSYGHRWAVLRDIEGNKHIVESDEYLLGCGAATHQAFEATSLGPIGIPSPAPVRIDGAEKGSIA